MRQNLRNLSNQTDLVLAWLAIFLWGTTWTQLYSGINGVANILHRLLTWNWESIHLITKGDAFMIIVSILYWICFAGVLFFIGLLIFRWIRTMRKGEYLSQEAREIRELKREVTDELKLLRRQFLISGGKKDRTNANKPNE